MEILPVSTSNNTAVGTAVGYRKASLASLDVSALDKPNFKLENLVRRFIHETNPDDAALSDSLPHAHTQASNTYNWHQKFKKSRKLIMYKDKDLPQYSKDKCYFNDLDYIKDFEIEFPDIVYNDALTSKLDFLTEPTDNDNDKIDIKQFSGDNIVAKNVRRIKDVMLIWRSNDRTVLSIYSYCAISGEISLHKQDQLRQDQMRPTTQVQDGEKERFKSFLRLHVTSAHLCPEQEEATEMKHDAANRP
nr:hypothetical protein [Tanacetum cinerariifolium]